MFTSTGGRTAQTLFSKVRPRVGQILIVLFLALSALLNTALALPTAAQTEPDLLVEPEFPDQTAEAQAQEPNTAPDLVVEPMAPDAVQQPVAEQSPALVAEPSGSPETVLVEFVASPDIVVEPSAPDNLAQEAPVQEPDLVAEPMEPDTVQEPVAEQSPALVAEPSGIAQTEPNVTAEPEQAAYPGEPDLTVEPLEPDLTVEPEEPDAVGEPEELNPTVEPAGADLTVEPQEPDATIEPTSSPSGGGSSGGAGGGGGGSSGEENGESFTETPSTEQPEEENSGNGSAASPSDGQEEAQETADDGEPAPEEESAPGGGSSGGGGGGSSGGRGGSSGGGGGSASPASQETKQGTDFIVIKAVRVLPSPVFFKSVEASPRDVLEFQISIIATGTAPTENVVLRDVLPSNLPFAGGLRINGEPLEGDLQKPIEVGTIQPGETMKVLFFAEVAAQSSFTAGITYLINSAAAYNDEHGGGDSATVRITRAFVQTPGAVQPPSEPEQPAPEAEEPTPELTEEPPAQSPESFLGRLAAGLALGGLFERIPGILLFLAVLLLAAALALFWKKRGARSRAHSGMGPTIHGF